MGELYTPVPDQFEIERPMQPKKAVGDYVESEGILVPRRFDDLEEAQYAAGQGVRVIARSEHPDEYSGPSGLGLTAEFKLDDSGEFHPDYRLSRGRALHDGQMRYAMVAGLSPQHYIDAMSESYWEKIPGTNVTVIADDAIEGRYHVFTATYEDGKSWPVRNSGAVVTEDGKVERQLSYAEDDSSLPERYKEIIDIYNSARRLPAFSNTHCPIVELQIGDQDGQIYFLQYHRARDEAFVDEELDPKDFDNEDGWEEADMVRGSYLGSRALELALWYPGFRRGSVVADGIELPEDGSMSMDCTFWTMDEYLGRQRIAHVLPTSFNNMYSKIADNHGPRSWMFKPQVSILMGQMKSRKDFLPEELQDQGFARAMDGNIVRVATDVVSDGRRAFVRFASGLILSKPAYNL